MLIRRKINGRLESIITSKRIDKLIIIGYGIRHTLTFTISKWW